MILVSYKVCFEFMFKGFSMAFQSGSVKRHLFNGKLICAKTNAVFTFLNCVDTFTILRCKLHSRKFL